MPPFLRRLHPPPRRDRDGGHPPIGDDGALGFRKDQNFVAET